MNVWIVALGLALLAGCAPVQRQQSLVVGSTTASTVGVGDVVAKVEKTRNLKNVFGAADIWGRKTNEGYSELRFAGVEADGTVVLFRQDLTIQTDEDVFTRSGIGVATTTSRGTATSFGNSTSANATSSTVYSSPRQANAFAIPSGAIPVRVPPGVKAVPFSGLTVQIIRADPVSLTFSIAE